MPGTAAARPSPRPATRDPRRTVVHSVGSTDAKGEEMNPVSLRIALAALK
ncbi:hypothetical protein ACFV5G_17985 [Streptomyces sp. NPDC059766]